MEDHFARFLVVFLSSFDIAIRKRPILALRRSCIRKTSLRLWIPSSIPSILQHYRGLLPIKIKVYKTGVINDPLCQTHSPSSSDHYFHLKLICFGR